MSLYALTVLPLKLYSSFIFMDGAPRALLPCDAVSVYLKVKSFLDNMYSERGSARLS